jgi:hypothetical protein
MLDVAIFPLCEMERKICEFSNRGSPAEKMQEIESEREQWASAVIFPLSLVIVIG